jgi:hypothetical protein
LGAREKDRSYGVDDEHWLAELGKGGGVVPVGIGRGEVVGKVREGEAELLVGLAWAELLWNGGSTAA